MEDDSLPTTSKPSAPQPARLDSPNFGSLLGFLSTSIVCWLLIGGIGYSPVVRDAGGNGLIPLAMLLIILQVAMLLPASSYCNSLWPGRAGTTYTAAVAGFGVAMLYVLWSAEGWAHWYQGLFWALGGVYGGILLEVTTGFWAWVKRRLERSARRERG